MSKLTVGAHVSAAGGIANAAVRAEKLSAKALQTFGSSPRQWLTRFPNREEVKKFKKLVVKARIWPVFLHAIYLINLASSRPEIYKKSLASLTDHLRIARAIEAEGLIFHLGSSKGWSRKDALEQTIRGMEQILRAVPGSTKLIMENSAGGGSKLGSEVTDLKYIMEGVNSPRIKVCFDTAHALAAGIINDYTATNIKALVKRWDRALGIDNLVVVHANDSKGAAGSHRDRHANIGEGYIGLKGFQNLAREESLRSRPWIVETPGFHKGGPGKKNIDLLRSCLRSK